MGPKLMESKYPFSVAFRFGATNTNTKHEDIVAFAHAVPWLCATADMELHIEIMGVSHIAATDIGVALNVKPRYMTEELIAESRKMGVKDPVAAQATTDLLLWIAALRRIGDSPLQTAWNQWRASRADPSLPSCVPIMLLEYNFGRSTQAKVDGPTTSPMTLYDGPTQTAP
jgi:hypothetical protein